MLVPRSITAEEVPAENQGDEREQVAVDREEEEEGEQDREEDTSAYVDNPATPPSH